MNQSGFNYKNTERSHDYRQPIGKKGGRYVFFKTRRFGKLHFEKRVSDAYKDDLLSNEALRKEFELGYGLDHPGIVKYLVFENSSIFEEFIDGVTLREMIDRNDPKLRSNIFLTSVCRQLLQALTYIHKQGIVHLDIKPENVMICNIGGAVKLLDFGAARNGVFDSTEGFTSNYMAPEQGGSKKTGIYTDIYLVGRLMSELAQRGGLNEKWRFFISKATASDPRSRFRNAEEALNGLGSFSPVINSPSKESSSSSLWIGIFIISLLGIGAGSYWWWSSRNGGNNNRIVASTTLPEFEQARDLIKGQGVPQDEAEGMRLMHIAAEKGDANAQIYLGLMYRDGCATLKRDPAKSLEWTLKAAEQGNEVAIEEMGYKYYEGFGVKQDYAEAMKWLKRAAEKGKTTAFSSIGIMYRNGEGVEQDYAQAEENFLKGAIGGNAYSAYLLARLYGHYMKPQKVEEALHWYEKASEMGSYRATQFLRDAYTSGDVEMGIEPDQVLATKYSVRLESTDAR